MTTYINQVQNQGYFIDLVKCKKLWRVEFRPILRAIGTLTNKLVKFFDKLLIPITTNEYTTKDLFSFAKEIDSTLILAIFDARITFHSHSSPRSYWSL